MSKKYASSGQPPATSCHCQPVSEASWYPLTSGSGDSRKIGSFTAELAESAEVGFGGALHGRCRAHP
jgi:hypothetical protein